MTRTERFVYELCRNSFLSLWSFPNPIGKNGNELCDVLVICEPDIIIFSVKEIQIKYSGNIEHDADKWMKKAISASVKQIYGAERFIRSTESILLKDRKTKIELPQTVDWKIHRVAVGFGRGNKFPLTYGNFGKGFAHVFDERSVQIVLGELDTIKDFVNYLREKERFINTNSYPITFGEEDMLGYYLSNGFKLPDKGDLVIFHDDIYSGLINDEDYKKVMSEQRVSHAWDNLIKILIEDFEKGQLTNSISRDDFELAIRQMAREDRNARKFLSEQFLDFIGVENPPKAKARIIPSLDKQNIKYLFLLGDHKDREQRYKELVIRSFVMIAKFDCDTVVGLATEKYNPKGYSLDLSYTHYPNLSDELRLEAIQLSDELGYFNNPEMRKI